MGGMDRLAGSLQEHEIQKYKQRYNQHRQESTTYFAGDSVYLQAQRPHGTEKRAYEIVSRTGRDTYLVNTDVSQPVEKHCYDLKLYNEALLGELVPLFWTRPPTRAKTQLVAQMTYPVSKILDNRPGKRHGVDKTDVMVRYEEFSADYDS